jgi:hypothetical protein
VFFKRNGLIRGYIEAAYERYGFQEICLNFGFVAEIPVPIALTGNRALIWLLGERYH